VTKQFPSADIYIVLGHETMNNLPWIWQKPGLPKHWKISPPQ